MITRRLIASDSRSSTSRSNNADRGNTSREALFPFLFPLQSVTLSARDSGEIARLVSGILRYYTGVTSDWRLARRAQCRSRPPHDKWRPWEIDVVVQFTDEKRAVAFERYLKSRTGCAFAKRHLR